MTIQIPDFLKTQIVFKLTGYETERYINLCANNGICLSDIEQKEDGIIATANGNCEKKLFSLAEKVQGEIVVIQRKGFLCKMIRLRFRIAFIIMPILAVLFLGYASQHIWTIRFSGNRMLTEDVLLTYLDSKDLSYGAYIGKLVPEELEGQIRTDFEMVTWVNVVVKGTTLYIDIKENSTLSYADDGDTTNSGCDMYAAESGEIFSIITRTGVPFVRCGDSVNPGDVLVSGSIPIYNTFGDTVINYQKTQADADIRILTELYYQDYIPFCETQKRYTGLTHKQYFLLLSDNEFHFPWWNEPETHYDIFAETNQVFLWDDFGLPIYYGTTCMEEYGYQEIYSSEESVKQRLLEHYEGYRDTLEENNIIICSDNMRYFCTENGVGLCGSIEVIKEIDYYTGENRTE